MQFNLMEDRILNDCYSSYLLIRQSNIVHDINFLARAAIESQKGIILGRSVVSNDASKH